MRMFIRALAFSVILGTGSAAWAQGGAGVIVGVNFANLDLSGSEARQFDRRTGFVGGVFLAVPLGPRFSVQPEVLYSQKGAKFKDSDAKARIELDYLDIPVLARMSSSGPSGLVLFAGPSFGFKLRARAKSEIAGETDDEDIGDDIESFDLGLVVGAGIQSGTFLLDGRYQWGLSNANKNEFDDTEVKNRVFSILVGVRF